VPREIFRCPQHGDQPVVGQLVILTVAFEDLSHRGDAEPSSPWFCLRCKGVITGAEYRSGRASNPHASAQLHAARAAGLRLEL
jgi:hypothetical protein